MIPAKLINELKRWISEKKYGNIQVNFANGKIVNINRVESVKVDALGCEATLDLQSEV